MPRSSRILHPLHCLLLLSLWGSSLLSLTPAHAVETRFGVDAELLSDDNVNRGPGGYEKSDTIASVEGNVSRSLLLSFRSGLLLRGSVRYERYLDFDDLSNLSLNGRVAWRFQPNPGLTGTSFELAAQARMLEHSDSNIRDGYLYSVSASLGKHFTDRVRLGGGISLDERRADEGEVYNLSSNSVWLSADYRLTTAIIYGSVTRISGDHAITTGEGTYPGLSGYYDASVVDTAFTDAFGAYAPWAYRIDAQTMSFELGVNLPLRGKHTLDFSARFYDSEADRGGFTYDGTQLRAVYFYRF